MNLYGYVTGNPIMGRDPLGLTDYDADFTKTQIALWQKEGLMAAKDNHGGDGIYDYKIYNSNDTFMIHNTRVSASMFGQYAAGYAGYYNGFGFGLWGVQIGGHIWEAKEDNHRDDNEVSFWGDDGGIDKHLIMLGAVDAYMDLRKKGLDSAVRFGWQSRPGQNRVEAVAAVQAYNRKRTGTKDSKADSPEQQGRNSRTNRNQRSRR